MPHPSIADSGARLLLDTIHPAYEPGEVSESRALYSDGTMKRAWHKSSLSLAHAGESQAPQANMYFGVTLRDGQGGTADHCTRAGALWADTDFKLWPDDADPRATAHAAARRLGLSLTACVNTWGGFHIYLALSEPADVRDPARRAAFERVNAAFARALCGPDRAPDAVHDVARILRQPGTLNHKYDPPRAVTLEWCDPARRYSLDDIATHIAIHHAWAMDAPHSAPPRSMSARVGAHEGGRPGDDYNARGDLAALLHAHGWRFLRERGHEEYWQRPGKTGLGISATLNYADSGLFYVFTSEGPPFAPLTAYSQFAVYALLEHDGDYQAAARALARQGYGQECRTVHLTALARPAGLRLPELARPLGRCLAEVAR